VSEWQLLKDFHLIPTLSGLAHVVVLPWFSFKIVLSILERLLMDVESR
jgi:hypothetical protein